MLGQILILALPLAAVGVIIGVLASLLGIGGGVVYVPLSYMILKSQGVPDDLAFKSALGTSLFTMFFTSSTAAIGHIRIRNYIRGGTAWLIVSCIIGSQIGSYTAVIVDSGMLKKAFAILVLITAFEMLRKKKEATDGGGHKGFMTNNAAAYALIGIATGFTGAVLGVGGGIVMIPALYLIMRRGFREVVGTSCIIIVLNSLSGFTHYMIAKPEHHLAYSIGYVNLLVAAVVAPGSMIGARYGVAWMQKINVRPLRILFVIIMIATALDLLGLFDAIGHLF